jgi:hypothetical protein
MSRRLKQSSDFFKADISIGCGVVAGLTFFVVAYFTPASMQPIVLVTLVAFLVGTTLSRLLAEGRAHRKWDAALRTLPIPFALAAEPHFFAEYLKIAEALTTIVKRGDPLFHDLARTQVEKMAGELATLARGKVVFDRTETWRTAYQHVLETTHVKAYYSVAWVRSDDYWNDAPGRQSLQFNYDLIGRGFRIERIHILADEVWPFDEKLPTDSILNLLADQQERGIHVSLVRESDLVNEPDLLCDFAVYGDRATGHQNIDERSRTQSFVLSFDDLSLRQALGRWERLKLFSISYQNLMDRLDA